MKQSNNMFSVMLVLVFTIIIDTMGMGLVIPVLPGLILNAHAPLVAASASESTKDVWYGLTMLGWPLGIFFGTAIVGVLSDRLGRKPFLLTCLGGMTLTYLLGVVAIYWHSASLLVLSRILNGGFSGSFPLAQASVVDISTDENRNQNIGWITVAASLGFILGPVATSSILSIFGDRAFSAPFVLAGILAFINVVLVFWLLPRFHQELSTEKTSFWGVLFSFRHIFIDKRIRLLALIFFLLQAGWGFYIMDLPAMMAQLFHLNASEIALMMAAVGGGALLNLLIVQKVLLRYLSLKKAGLLTGLAFTCVLVLVTEASLPFQWVLVVIAGLLDVLFYSILIALFSKAVTSTEQGKVLGATASVFGISWVIVSVALTKLLSISVVLPIVAAAICFGLGFLLFFRVRV